MRFHGARIVQAYALFQFGSAQQPIRFRDGPFAMDPLRLNRIQPGAFHRQTAGDNPYASLARFYPLIVGVDPRADRLAGVPRGVIPEEQ